MKHAAFFLSAMLAAAAASAGDSESGPQGLPAYRQECSACHVPYPPGLLPAASWRRLMGSLPQHYGTDASLDAATRQAISTWLEAHASRRAAEPPQDRITRGAWFLREHREVPAGTWQRPAVRSAANCAACHAGAAGGDFDEHQVRIPR